MIPSSPYEAGFIVNISGPVRAIRSSMGANSGQYTVSTDIYYPQREDSTVDLRVHVIPGAMVFNDFATGVTGLRYSDSNTPAGVPIDGVPDAVADHADVVADGVGWAGHAGHHPSLTTDIAGLATSTYYLDQIPASPVPCTGDAAAWGQSGAAVVGPGGGNLPCTDPTIYGSPGACPTVAGQATANTLSCHRPSLLRIARLHRGPGGHPGRRHVHAPPDQRHAHHRLSGLAAQVTRGVECR